MQQVEDGAEQALDTTTGGGDPAGAVSDLADEAEEHGVNVQVSNDAEGKLDDWVGDGHDEAEAGLQFDSDNCENFYVRRRQRGFASSRCERVKSSVTYRP